VWVTDKVSSNKIQQTLWKLKFQYLFQKNPLWSFTELDEASSEATLYFIVLRTKHCPHHSVRKHSQSVISVMWDPSFIRKQNKSSPSTRHGGAWGERRYSPYSFSTSALDGGEWSASRPGRALPRGKDPRYPLYRGWVGPRAGLDTEDRGKTLCPCRGSNPDRPVVQPAVRHYTAWAKPDAYKITVTFIVLWGSMFKSLRL
jgi:hypothetical protein